MLSTGLVFVIIMGLICLLGFFNEKVTKLTYEIALLLFSTALGVVILVVAMLVQNGSAKEILGQFQVFDIEKFLMEGVLCFMLFAGSCHLKLIDFKKMARQVTVLAFVCTFLGACFYGFLFYCASLLIGLQLSIPVCLMFGSIVAPTDPIAATSILNKFGLPENISFVIEGESLFNDGVGVALFVCFSGMAAADPSSSGGFFAVMAKEILGALLVGIAVTFLSFLLYRSLKNVTLRIFVSLTAVALSYYLCEVFGFSGAIASVVCGILFSALRSAFMKNEDGTEALKFDSFWETLDCLCNSALYVMLGLTAVRLFQMRYIIILALVAVAANLIARFLSLSASSLIMGKVPDGYDRFNFIKLLTWGGLRGGLSIALAMSTKEIVPSDIYYIILGGTYTIVLFTTVVQGLSMKAVYRRISASVERKNRAKD